MSAKVQAYKGAQVIKCYGNNAISYTIKKIPVFETFNTLPV
jgi:hypothetical protein